MFKSLVHRAWMKAEMRLVALEKEMDNHLRATWHQERQTMRQSLTAASLGLRYRLTEWKASLLAKLKSRL